MAVRTTAEIDRVSSVSSMRLLLLQFGDRLLGVREIELLAMMTMVSELNLLSLPGTLQVASGVSTSDAWTVNAMNGAVVVLGPALATITSLDDLSLRRDIQISEIPPQISALVLNHKNSLLLCESFQLHDPEFGQFAAVCLDLKRGDVINSRCITSMEPLEAIWVEELESFMIYDFQSDSLWRWSPLKGEPLTIDETVLNDLQVTSFIFESSGRRLTKILSDFGGNQFKLLRGIASQNNVSWGTPVALPDGEYESINWHPKEDIFACIHTIGGEMYLSLARSGCVGTPFPESDSFVCWSIGEVCYHYASNRSGLKI